MSSTFPRDVSTVTVPSPHLESVGWPAVAVVVGVLILVACGTQLILALNGRALVSSFGGYSATIGQLSLVVDRKPEYRGARRVIPLLLLTVAALFLAAYGVGQYGHVTEANTATLKRHATVEREADAVNGVTGFAVSTGQALWLSGRYGITLSIGDAQKLMEGDTVIVHRSDGDLAAVRVLDPKAETPYLVTPSGEAIQLATEEEAR